MFVLFLSLVFLSEVVKCRGMFRAEIGNYLQGKVTTVPPLSPLTAVTENTVGEKTQLRKSLSHVKSVLVDIEGKIENERKLLAQIDYNLDYNADPGFLDYNVTDIWWPTTSAHVGGQWPSRIQEGARATPGNLKSFSQRINRFHNYKTKPALRDVPNPTLNISDIVAQWVRSESNTTGVTQTTTPITTLPNQPTTTITTMTTTTVRTITTTRATTTTSLTPFLPIATTIVPERSHVSPGNQMPAQHTFPPGVPSDWPYSTSPATPVNPYMEQMKANMRRDNHGYFSAFLTKFLEIVSAMEVENIPSIVKAVEVSVAKMLADRKFDVLGQTHQGTIHLLIAHMHVYMTPFATKQQAGLVNYIMKNKRVFMSRRINLCFDYYDALVTKGEGERLFAILEEFEKYPAEGRSENELILAMLEAMMAPLHRVKGTKEHRKFMSYVNEAIQEEFPNWRAQSQEIHDLYNKVVGKSNNVSADIALLRSLSRRSMGSYSYKKILLHILLKHPKIYKRFHRHLRHGKKRHHHRSHKKRHHVSHKKHKKLRHKISPLTSIVEPKEEYQPVIRQKAVASPELGESGGSGAYYREPENEEVKRPVKKNSKKYIKTSKIPKKKQSKPINKKDHKKVTKKRLHPKLPMEYTNDLKAKYLKILKQKLGALRKKRKSFRRFMIETSETEVDEKSSLENANDMNIINNIRETSSYSDEEEHMRANLYDALRHGNRSFVQFRTFDDDVDNHTFWDISSGSDDEWVLKNNIYKAFEQ